MKKLKFKISAPLAAALAAIIIVGIALMIPPIIGLADNGDFYRIINNQGLYKLDRFADDQYLNYASSKFGIYEYFDEYAEGLVSTQIPFILLAKAFNAVFATDGLFDIRFLSIIYLLYLAAALYLLVDYTSQKASGAAKYLIAALSVFVFADTGYTEYFNSFYAEALVLVSFLMAMATALLMTQKRYNPYLLLAISLINCFILTGAKQQNAPLGVLFGIMYIILAFIMGKSKDQPSEEGLVIVNADNGTSGTKPYILNKRMFKVIATSLGMLMCVAGVGVYVLIPQEFVNINSYHAMTRGILMSSENPEQTLDEFGIDKQYSMLNNSIYYERYPIVDVDSQILEDTFYSKYNFISIAMHYITHPDKLYKMIGVTTGEAYNIAPVSYGTYERVAGKEPAARTDYFSLYSTLKPAIVPKTAGFVIVWMIAVLVFNYKDPCRDVILAFIILAGLSQFAVSIIGAGDADLSKHVFLYNVAFDLVNFICGASIITSLCSSIDNKAKSKRGKRAKQLHRPKTVPVPAAQEAAK